MRKKNVLKKLPSILLSAALALSVIGSGQATAATNLIQNGGFEGPAAGGSGANWSFGTIGNTLSPYKQRSPVKIHTKEVRLKS